jgi:hypothetical protein
MLTSTLISVLNQAQIIGRIPQMERITASPRINCATPPFPEVVWQYIGTVAWWCGNPRVKGCGVATHETLHRRIM